MNDANVPRANLAVVQAAFGCNEVLAGSIMAQCHKAAAEAGAMLYPRGDGAQETVLLLQGRAREVAYGRNGTLLILHQLEAGELFGALLAMDRAATAAQVEAVTAALTGHFAPHVVVRLMETYSGVAMALARQLAMRLQQMRDRMAETVLLSARGRICAELARLAEENADRTIRPLPVFTDLAVISQTTRETVSRTISDLEKRGILRRVPGGLHLVAPHRLEEMLY